jgi:hypothetical protein
MNITRELGAAFGALAVSAVAHAGVVGFDEIPASTLTEWGDGVFASVGTVTASYAGFTWYGTQSQSAEGAPAHSVGVFRTGGFANGYSAGVTSGDQALFNAWGAEIRISRAERFSFAGAWFTAAWNAGLTLSFTGLRDGATVGTASVVLGAPTAAAWVGGLDGMADIDELRISSAGGSLFWTGGGGTSFVMDDFTFGAPVPVPGPGPLALGLVALAIAGRRRR